MRKAMLAVILVLSTATVSAQTITKRDAQMAWEASGHDLSAMRTLIHIYTALQEAGYRSSQFTHVFQFFRQYRLRVESGVIRLGDSQTLGLGFWAYLSHLYDAVGTSEYDEIYTLVFAWNQSVRVSELLEYMTILSILFGDDDVLAKYQKNWEEAKKILNIP